MSESASVPGVPARPRLAAGTAGRPVWEAAYASLLLALDAVAITVASAIALALRFGQQASPQLGGPLVGHVVDGLSYTFIVAAITPVWVAVLGSNGSGKSHFLRLVAGQDVRHTGAVRLGARVVAGWFAQTHDQPSLAGRTLVEVLHRGGDDDDRRGLERGQAIGALRRYELHEAADQRFDALSGGQQARFQVLLLELGGATLLLLDEPTDNLDLASAEALEEGLETFDGTVLAVTHDRWFARGFDRFLVFGGDGRVYESAEPVWEEGRVQRARG